MNKFETQRTLRRMYNSTPCNLIVILVIFFSVFNIVKCSEDNDRKREIERLKEQVQLKKLE